MKHTNLWNELDLDEPQDHSFLIVSIGVGIMIFACAIILLAGTFMSLVS